VYSVNNGSCHELASLNLLTTILTHCDQLHISLIALWVPRESKLLPDYLSYFASYINKEETSGRVSDIGAL
jgi:hypothetical protein